MFVFQNPTTSHISVGQLGIWKNACPLISMPSLDDVMGQSELTTFNAPSGVFSGDYISIFWTYYYFCCCWDRWNGTGRLHLTQPCLLVEVCVPGLVLKETRWDGTEGHFPNWKDRDSTEFFYNSVKVDVNHVSKGEAFEIIIIVNS